MRLGEFHRNPLAAFFPTSSHTLILYMPTENIPTSNQPSSDRRPAGPPLWMGFNLRMQPTMTTPYTYQNSPHKYSPSELHGEKAQARVVSQYGRSDVGDPALSQNAQTDSELGRGTVQSGDQSSMDERLLLHPNILITKYSRATKYRWGCFRMASSIDILVILTISVVVLHIILCLIVLGIAVAIHQAANQGIWEAYPQGSQPQKRWRGPGQSLEESFKGGLPPPEYTRLGFWRVVPFISVIPSGLAIAVLYATFSCSSAVY